MEMISKEKIEMLINSSIFRNAEFLRLLAGVIADKQDSLDENSQVLLDKSYGASLYIISSFLRIKDELSIELNEVDRVLIKIIYSFFTEVGAPIPPIINKYMNQNEE